MKTDPEPRVRFRALGFRPGVLPPGPLNAITDVPGLKVGHFTFRPAGWCLQASCRADSCGTFFYIGDRLDDVVWVGMGLARQPATFADTQDPPCANEYDPGKVWQV